MKQVQFKVFNSRKFDSRIKSQNVTNSERWVGFFFGPAGVILLNAILASYLNVFYTDVLKLSGVFLVVFPVISKIIDALTNIVMGQIIDRTHSKQGKARPWILIAGPIVAISAILAFTIPQASTTVQLLWIVFSFNLYYSIGYTMYYMSHSMLVPLSTRNSKQRDGLAMLTNMAMCLIPGMFVALIFPMVIIPSLGVDQGKWITMICIFAIIALPCIMLEYFFTKERVTEETRKFANTSSHTIKEQLKACFSSKYWIIIMGIMFLIQFCTNLQNTSLIYYCNWVLGTYNDGTTQTLVSAIGNAPLGFGILLMWPLVKKFSKQKVMIAGLAIAIVAGILFMLNPSNMGWVLMTLAIRAFGALPITYITMAMLSDALDHVEWQSGFRTDGLSMSIYTIILTVCAGLSQGAFNLGLNLTGYVPPAADGSWVAQSSAVQSFFVWGYQGVFAVCMFVILVLFWFYDVEKHLPNMQADIISRHKAEAEAQGIEYVSPEELAAKEQEEQERIAEENRINELKASCEKKGLNFDEEEAKYQAKLAAAKAKEEAKKAKKNKK